MIPRPADEERDAGQASAPPAGTPSDRVFAELADMQVAHEELRVAEEEMRVQKEQITQLLLQHAAERRWRDHMAALVPVGLCVTDGNGSILEANPALAVQLGTGLHRLRGKPLAVYLAREDVQAFRTALRAIGGGSATEHRLVVTIQPRHRPTERVHLFGFPETTDHRASIARVHWVVVPEHDSLGQDVVELPAGSEPPGPETHAPIPAAEVIGLAGSLAELSALPVGDLDRQRLLTRMAVLVRGAVPAADWVSITLGSPTEPQRLGADSEEAQSFDGFQALAGEGPCIEAYQSASVVVTDDVTVDPRWPRLAPRAASGTVRSVLALPVHDDAGVIGGVNVYSAATGAFGAPARRIAELATAAVAGILQNVADREAMQELAQNLERALTSRAVIDQAKGMIMARLEVDADDAFARLVNLSSRLNVKVRDLATLIVEGHGDALFRVAEETGR